MWRDGMLNLSDNQSTSMIERARRNTLGDLLTRTAARYPDKLAFSFKERKVTYAQLEKLVNQTAQGMRDMGIQKGTRLGLLSKNSLDFIILMFSAARLGAVTIPINYMLTKKDIAYILNHAEITGLFTAEEYKTVLDDAVEEVPQTIGHYYVLETDDNRNNERNEKHWKSFADLQKNDGEAKIEVELFDDDLAQVLYTSGTESNPKGVMLSHKSVISEYVSCVVDGKMSEQDVLIHALPFYHSAQLHVFLGPSMYLGATGIILDQADPTTILETIEKEEASQLFAPPTVWIALLRHSKFDEYQLDSLEKCYYGAAIMPKEILKELAERLPNAKFWNFYGQTEVAPLATALQPEDQLRKLGSAGKPSLHVETRIVDSEDNEVARGEIGEIVHRTPHAMLGYLNNPEKTAEAFQNGWFHSGDLGTMDDEGYITIVDRKKDIINTGGISVSSREIEEIIYEVKEVAEVAVIGLKDDYWIEAVTAIIVTKDGFMLTQEEVLTFCRGKLPTFKAPKNVLFIDTLPKNPSGKVLKKDLREKYEVK